MIYPGTACCGDRSLTVAARQGGRGSSGRSRLVRAVAARHGAAAERHLECGSPIGSVIGIWLAGRIPDTTGSYPFVFSMLGLLMPLAYIFGTLLMGKIEPLTLAEGFESQD
jgi:hypothetical protein